MGMALCKCDYLYISPSKTNHPEFRYVFVVEGLFICINVKIVEDSELGYLTIDVMP